MTDAEPHSKEQLLATQGAGRSATEWLQQGIDNGWCTGWYCENHDGFAYEDGDEVAELWEEHEGSDFCWNIVRIKAPVSHTVRAKP